MLKKRILASSLASVMALSSVSVVAFADDIKTEAVTKDQLQDYVDSFKGFLEDGIFEYGTTHGTQFQDAIDHAENVLDDSDSNADDYTAAYQMVKNVRESMKNYTSEQLQDLLDDYEDIYDEGNILNADIGDIRYEQGSYDTFFSAYEDAKAMVSSDDGRLITDAYLELEKAKGELDELDTVTKGAFRSAWREYENLITKFDDYEDWRRGECSVNPSTTDHGKKHNKLTEEDYVEFGTIKAIVTNYTGTYANLEEEATSTCSAWFKGTGTHGMDVESFIKEQYERFDAIESAGVTSDTDINNAYNAMKDAVKVFNGWKADDTRRSNKGSISSTINKYRADLVKDFASDIVDGMITNVVDSSSNAMLKKDGKKLVVTATNGIELAVTDTTPKFIKLTADDGTGTYDSTGTTKLKVAKGQDIVKYIPIKAADVQAKIDAGSTTPDPDTKYADIATSGTADAYTTAVTNANAKIIWVKAGTNKTDAVTTKTTETADYTPVYQDLLIAVCAYTADNTGATSKAIGDVTGNDLDKYNEIFSTTKKTIAEIKYPKENTAGDAWEDEGASVAAQTYYEVKINTGKDAQVVDPASNTNGKIKTTFEVYNKETTGLMQKVEAAKSALDTDIQELREEIDAEPVPSAEKLAQWGELKTVLDLVEAYELAETKSGEDRKTQFATAYGTKLGGLDELSTVVTPSGSVAEYTLLNRKLTYVLNDLYPETKSDKYTRKDVADLIEKCNDLLDDTIEAEVFATKHNDLRDATRAALEWKTKAYKVKNYKEGNAVVYDDAKYTYTSGDVTIGSNMNATAVYKALNPIFEALEDQYAAYPVSYAEVKDLISTVADGIDKNAYKKGVDEIKKLLATVSVELSTLDAIQDENEAFTEERKFIPYNRVQTAKDNSTDASDAEKQLYEDYLALKKAIEKPAVGDGDINGDGFVNALDALTILEYAANAKELTDAEKAAADVNGDGAINALDALQILENAAKA